MKYCVLNSLSKRFVNPNHFSNTEFIQSLCNIYQSLPANNFRVAQRNYSDLSSDLNIPVLRLLTKDNCTLCEDAKNKLFSAPGSYSERLVLKEVNILKEGNEELFDLYRYEIPVFFLGKKFISKNKIDLKKLEKELQHIELNHSSFDQNE